MSNPSLLILPGDGIGPEVMAEVRKIVEWFELHRGLVFDIFEDHAGAAAIDAYETYLRDETLARALEVDAVLFGAVGAPGYDQMPFEEKPEQALLKLRKEMDLFTNLRPVQCLDALSGFSSLRPEIVSGLDIVIVRETTAGIYFGEPRGIIIEDGERVGINTHRYSESEIRRVARSALDVARARTGRVCSIEKSNVMEAGLLWREVVTSLRDAEYPDIELTHMLADSGLMQLVRAPKQFDVILTDNLFGDLLSDAASMLSGSLGLLPSATLGSRMSCGRSRALYEPIHGSAPDIAGQGKANPIAAILSFAMALRLSFDRPDEAMRLERAIETAVSCGFRTIDIFAGQSGEPCSTAQMGDAIIRALDD